MKAALTQAAFFSEQYAVSIFSEYIKELLFLRCNFIFHIRA